MGNMGSITGFNAEASVLERYAAAAVRREPSLCCPTRYDPKLLEIIPDEVLEKDYGCGDPTPYVLPGETVVDLGSGAGKLCFIAAQLVGPNGRVIGIDANRQMLAVARRNAPLVAERLGYANATFRCGLIQNLRLDLERLEEHLATAPVSDTSGYLRLRQLEEQLAEQEPLLPDNSVDCILSNCVFNLVRHSDRARLFQEMFRVLRPGGRAAISDIVSDRDVPDSLQRDPELWSGCLAGAFREDRFLDAFVQAGFIHVYVAERQVRPWRVINDIEFRSATVVAYKPPVPSYQKDCSVVYRGPFRMVEDDLGNRFVRGRNMRVSARTYEAIRRSNCREMFLFGEPAPDKQIPTCNEPTGYSNEMGFEIEPSPSCCSDGRCC